MRIKVYSQETMKKKHILSKQLQEVKKQEQKFLSKKENRFVVSKIKPVVQDIRDIIPSTLEKSLNTAFYKGFQLIFEKGSAYIEKTYNKDKIQLEYDLNNYAIDKRTCKKYMNQLDRQSKISKTVNSSFAVLEGGALGFLGIGLPDIPLFLAVIIRNIQEIALSYGYDYDSNEEKQYILYLICAAMTRGKKQRQYDSRVDLWAESLDSDIVNEGNLDDIIKESAEILSEVLLTAKFLQGIPIIGAIGGVVNHSIIRRIGEYAAIKYKKRYLLGKLNL